MTIGAHRGAGVKIQLLEFGGFLHQRQADIIIESSRIKWRQTHPRIHEGSSSSRRLLEALVRTQRFPPVCAGSLPTEINSDESEEFNSNTSRVQEYMGATHAI
jgi:hypothetical protein